MHTDLLEPTVGFDALHCARADAEFTGDFVHTLVAPRQCAPDAIFNLSVDLGTTEPHTLGTRSPDTNGRALRDHAALKFRERAADLEQQLPYGASRVQVLLLNEYVHAGRFEDLDGAEKVDKATAKAINRPSHHNIEATTASILEHRIKAGPLVAPLRATDASIVVRLHDLPPSPLGDGGKFSHLVLDGLLVRAHSDVERGAFHLALRVYSVASIGWRTHGRRYEAFPVEAWIGGSQLGREPLGHVGLVLGLSTGDDGSNNLEMPMLEARLPRRVHDGSYPLCALEARSVLPAPGGPRLSGDRQRIHATCRTDSQDILYRPNALGEIVAIQSLSDALRRDLIRTAFAAADRHAPDMRREHTPAMALDALRSPLSSTSTRASERGRPYAGAIDGKGGTGGGTPGFPCASENSPRAYTPGLKAPRTLIRSETIREIEAIRRAHSERALSGCTGRESSYNPLTSAPLTLEKKNVH